MATEILTAASQTIIDQASWSANPPSIGDIDEGSSPDGSWWVAANNNVSPTARISMPTPSGDLNTGAGLQTFHVYVREFDSGQSGTATLTITVYESGDADNTPHAQSSAMNITSASGEWLTFTWDATGLTNADGSTVEMDFEITKSGGSPGTRQSADVGSVYWTADYNDGSGYAKVVNGVSSYSEVNGIAIASFTEFNGVA